MRVISLYQPYATLVVLGLKKFETRSWDTKYRGPLAIHATQSMPDWCRELCYKEPVRSALAEYGWNALNLPKGKIVGQVVLHNTVRSDVWLADRLIEPGVIDPEWSNEFYFGDYSGGRFAWELRHARQLSEPIPAKGSQGFWNFDLT